MYSKHPPFNAATPQDPFYVTLASNNFSVFWDKHTEHKSEGKNFFSEDFKDLFQKMTQLDPEKRITLDDVMNHPWYTKECQLKQKEVEDIFKKRFKSLN
jgi:serine/threonine protein kinase